MPVPGLRLLLLSLTAVAAVEGLAALAAPTLAAAADAQARPGAPVPDLTPPSTLAVTGAVASPLTLTAADLQALPRTTVEAREGDRTARYEGVLAGELLKRAGAPVGEALRGEALASYVVASAVDGYRAVFSLAELDPALTSNDVLVADTVDGRPLFAYQGPWRLVAPKDARGARSVRMLHRLEVVRLPQ